MCLARAPKSTVSMLPSAYIYRELFLALMSDEVNAQIFGVRVVVEVELRKNRKSDVLWSNSEVVERTVGMDPCIDKAIA